MNNPIFIIGLVEDRKKFIEDFPPVFMHYPEGKLSSTIKKQTIEKYFKFIYFNSVGAATSYIKSNSKPTPDFFIIDVDFSELDSEMIQDENRKYSINLRLSDEQKITRGLNFFEFIRKEKPAIKSMLLTAKYNDPNEKKLVGEEMDRLKLKKGEDYELKDGSGGAISFTRNIYAHLQQLAINLINKEFCSDSPISYLEWNAFIEKVGLDGFLNSEIKFTQRNAPYNKCQIKSLMMGWGKWEKVNGNLDLVYDDSIIQIFLDILKNVGITTGEKVAFKGIWKEKFMQQALEMYRHPKKSIYNYSNDVESINVKASELFWDFYNEIIENQDDDTIAASLFLKQRDCAIFCKNGVSIENNESFRDTFMMALIHRRFLIAVSYLQEIKTISYIEKAIKFLDISTTTNNLSTYISTDLGLTQEGIKSQWKYVKIIYLPKKGTATIMKEETEFLNNFIKPYFIEL